jgi:hypothetical protein
VAAVGEPSRATTAATGPQPEEAVVVASQALVPCDPYQGREWARLGSQSAGGRETAKAPAGGDSAPRRGRSRGSSGAALEHALEVLVLRSDGCVMS